MRGVQRMLLPFFLVSVVTAVCLQPTVPALADGGPIFPEPRVWALLQEAKQIAVVKLGSDRTAQVDLFISLLDNSGSSHEVVFFFPLGIEATNFRVAEEPSPQFESALTNALDATLREETSRNSSLRSSLRNSFLAGSLLINGAWSWPLWLIVSLGSCVSAPVPVAVYETPSSQIALYGLDEDTDLVALVSTAGLDPAVQQTLVRLKGQQIAVVTLQTQPPAKAGSGQAGTGQPGLHLVWTTTLVSHSAEATYSYPLGTGTAWAQPIEVTRLYVTAPPETDFSVQYPRLGNEISGYRGNVPLILQDPAQPAYAVESVVGSFGRIWRATYVQSNAAEDVVVTRLAGLSRETQSELATIARLERMSPITLMLSLLVALALWLVTWRYAMPRLLGIQYRWRDLAFWRDAFRWTAVYPLANLAVALVAAFGLTVTLGLGSRVPHVVGVLASITIGLVLLVACLLLLVTLPGFASLIFFARDQARKLGISRGRAIRAYAVVVLIANAGYLLFAGIWAALAGAL